MPKLGDYLGQLVSEIAMARMQADLESVRLGDLYAQHPLLRHFPVPRFRLPEVKLEIPVAIESAAEPPKGAPRGKIGAKQATTAVMSVVAKRLAAGGHALATDERKRLESAMRERLGRLEQPQGSALSTTHFLDESLHALEQHLPASVAADEARARLLDEVRAAAGLELQKLAPPLPRVSVVVETAKLKEIDRPEALLRIEVRIAEEAVEWRVNEKDGKTSSRLIPE